LEFRRVLFRAGATRCTHLHNSRYSGTQIQTELQRYATLTTWLGCRVFVLSVAQCSVEKIAQHIVQTVNLRETTRLGLRRLMSAATTNDGTDLVGKLESCKVFAVTVGRWTI